MLSATLDFDAARDRAAALSFAAPAALGTLDALLWRPAAVAETFAAEIERMDEGRAVLSASASERLLTLGRHWRAAFRTLLDAGGALAAFVPRAAPLGVHTLQEVVDYDLLEPLPAGAAVRRDLDAPPALSAPGEPFRAFLHRAGRELRAVAALERAPGRAVLLAADGSVCGTYAYLHPGHLLLLPEPAPGCDRGRLFDAVVDLLRQLRAPGRLSALYPAAAHVDIAGERADRALAATLAAEQARIAAELAAARSRLDVAALVKQLVGGDARGVSRAAAFVLHALGAYTQAGMADDASVAFEHRGRAAVLTLVDDRSVAPREWIERARSRARAWSPVARPALLYCAENALAPGERRGPADALVAAARDAGVPLVAAQTLLEAYERRDAEPIERIIA